MVAIPIEVYDLVAEATGKPDLAAIAGALRGNREWSAEARAWLADLFGPPASATWHLKVSARSRGQPPKIGLPHLDAVLFFEAEDERLSVKHGHRRREDAIHMTFKKFRISRSTLEKAIVDVESARQQHDDIIAAED